MCTKKATPEQEQEINRIVSKKHREFIGYKIVQCTDKDNPDKVYSQYGYIGYPEAVIYPKNKTVHAEHIPDCRSWMKFNLGIHVFLRLEDAREYWNDNFVGLGHAIARFKVQKEDIIEKVDVDNGIICVLVKKIKYTGSLVKGKK